MSAQTLQSIEARARIESEKSLEHLLAELERVAFVTLTMIDSGKWWAHCNLRLNMPGTEFKCKSKEYFDTPTESAADLHALVFKTIRAMGALKPLECTHALR